MIASQPDGALGVDIDSVVEFEPACSVNSDLRGTVKNYMPALACNRRQSKNQILSSTLLHTFSNLPLEMIKGNF